MLEGYFILYTVTHYYSISPYDDYEYWGLKASTNTSTVLVYPLRENVCGESESTGRRCLRREQKYS